VQAEHLHLVTCLRQYLTEVIEVLGPAPLECLSHL